MAFNGNTEKTQMRYFVRDHSKEKFAERHETLRRIQKAMNDKYGEGTVELEIAESYYNMREKIEPCMHLVETAKKAITDAGLTPDVSPVRGGTGRGKAQLQGPALPQSWDRRFRFPRPLRAHYRGGHGSCRRHREGYPEELCCV